MRTLAMACLLATCAFAQAPAGTPSNSATSPPPGADHSGRNQGAVGAEACNFYQGDARR